jgi:hypothetical protein
MLSLVDVLRAGGFGQKVLEPRAMAQCQRPPSLKRIAASPVRVQALLNIDFSLGQSVGKLWQWQATRSGVDV